MLSHATHCTSFYILPDTKCVPSRKFEITLHTCHVADIHDSDVIRDFSNENEKQMLKLFSCQTVFLELHYCDGFVLL